VWRVVRVADVSSPAVPRARAARSGAGAGGRDTYRGGEDAEVGLGEDGGARLEGGGGASAELHLSDRTWERESVSMVTGR
jgi:hypothetical protein